MSWYRQWLQISIGFVSDCFWTQAYVTTFDISLNISWEGQPIVFPANKVFGFIDAKMSYQKVVVVPTDKLCSNDFRYKR